MAQDINLIRSDISELRHILGHLNIPNELTNHSEPSPSRIQPPRIQPATQLPPLERSIDPKNAHTIQLGDQTITFDRTKVKDPPVSYYSQDISRLFREWNNSEELVINGHKIPLKYWSHIYQEKEGITKHTWSVLKTQWNRWKVRTVPARFLLIHAHSVRVPVAYS